MKRYTVNGVTGTILELSKHYNISYNTVMKRMERGMSLKDALLVPAQVRNKEYTVQGVRGNLSYLCVYFHRNHANVKSRLDSGMSIEEALAIGKRVSYNVKGVTGGLSELCKHFGVNYSTVWKRLSLGWAVEEAFFCGKRGKRRHNSKTVIYSVNGVSGTLPELCRYFNKPYPTVYNRIFKLGVPVEKALLADKLPKIKYNM